MRDRPEVAADSSVVRMEVSQGTLNHYYTCISRRDGRGRWMSTCFHTGDSISALPFGAPLTGAAVNFVLVVHAREEAAEWSQQRLHQDSS